MLVFVLVFVLVGVLVLIRMLVFVLVFVLIRMVISGCGLDGFDGVSKGDEDRRIPCSVLQEVLQP